MRRNVIMLMLKFTQKFAFFSYHFSFFVLIISTKSIILYIKICRIILWLKWYQLEVYMTSLCWTRIFFVNIQFWGKMCWCFIKRLALWVLSYSSERPSTIFEHLRHPTNWKNSCNLFRFLVLKFHVIECRCVH